MDYFLDVIEKGYYRTEYKIDELPQIPKAGDSVELKREYERGKAAYKIDCVKYYFEVTETDIPALTGKAKVSSVRIYVSPTA